jgi:Mitochondrial carrier protein
MQQKDAPAPQQQQQRPDAPASNRAHLVFLAGSISGIAEGITIQPLEMIKTRAQIHTGAHLRVLPTIRGACCQRWRSREGCGPRRPCALCVLRRSAVIH